MMILIDSLGFFFPQGEFRTCMYLYIYIIYVLILDSLSS